MKIAIMQPYFAPYIGYFQLIAAVDIFVILDDVNFIKGGWINRNRVLCNGTPTWMTMPLLGASPNKKIFELEIAQDNGWKRKTMALFKQSYAQAPHGEDALKILQNWMENATGGLSHFLVNSLAQVCTLIGIKTKIIPTSLDFSTTGLHGSEKVLAICKELRASHYINAPGGRSLYSHQAFAESGIRLGFINPSIPTLPNQPPEAGTLSILHLLAHGLGKDFPRGVVDFDNTTGNPA